VAAGEAALWPADIPHGAWTEHSQMRAIVVEFGGADDQAAAVLEGKARALASGVGAPGAGAVAGGAVVGRGEGGLAERPTGPDRRDDESGEPA
jgi:hypothetical protein